jgi:hypothetical protein
MQRKSGSWSSGTLREPPVQRADGAPEAASGGMRYGGWRMTTKPPIFDFLRSRGARMSCPFCGREEWHGWDERITLDHAIGSGSLDRRAEAFPLTCANCGFIRLQAAHVLDDPRDETRNQRD